MAANPNDDLIQTLMDICALGAGRPDLVGTRPSQHIAEEFRRVNQELKQELIERELDSAEADQCREDQARDDAEDFPEVDEQTGRLS